ncbi:acetyltransferase (GNAT) family domain-containing protein [Ditylenchus destructor]|nr:acetyltransferase (GNAT) family domain-containing protein [Ditylenchus destructor]
MNFIFLIVALVLTHVYADDWYDRIEASFNRDTNSGRVWIPKTSSGIENIRGGNPYIGCASYHVRGDSIELGNIAVTESYRGQKISKALMKKFIEEAQSNLPNYHTIKLLVSDGLANKPAIALYKRFGFDWLTGDAATSNYWMTLDLNTYVEPAGIH